MWPVASAVNTFLFFGDAVKLLEAELLDVVGLHRCRGGSCSGTSRYTFPDGSGVILLLPRPLQLPVCGMLFTPFSALMALLLTSRLCLFPLQILDGLPTAFWLLKRRVFSAILHMFSAAL